MKDKQLTDGTWVTPSFQGMSFATSQCHGDSCQWENMGPPAPAGLMSRVPVQLERCLKCDSVRGRYIGDPYQQKYLEFDGQRYPAERIAVIAAPPGPNVKQVEGSRLLSCQRCVSVVLVDPESSSLIDRGATLLCLACSRVVNPESPAGKDPDTGQEFTVEAALRRYKMNGAYKAGDVKPV